MEGDGLWTTLKLVSLSLSLFRKVEKDPSKSCSFERLDLIYLFGLKRSNPSHGELLLLAKPIRVSKAGCN